MTASGARPVRIVKSVFLSASDAIAEVVVALVWDVVDPVVAPWTAPPLWRCLQPPVTLAGTGVPFVPTQGADVDS
jgi:hypothetical protein